MDKLNKKIIVLAALAAKTGIYGHNGGIPWKLSGDMQRFKELTLGETVVMGRGTWESIPARVRPLPNRQNIIIASKEVSHPQGVFVVKSIDQAMEVATSKSIFFIGGERIWYPAMEIADEVILTIVYKDLPTEEKGICRAERLLNIEGNWRHLSFVESLQRVDEESGLRYSFSRWERRS